MLAKYRFIELAVQEGREKPWRLVTRSLTATADFDDPASIYALKQVSTLVVERESERLRRWIQRSENEPQEWVEASTIATSVFWATAEEVAEVSKTLSELTDRFKERWEDPSARPDGARVVRFLGATTVDADLPASSGTGSAVAAAERAED